MCLASMSFSNGRERTGVPLWCDEGLLNRRFQTPYLVYTTAVARLFPACFSSRSLQEIAHFLPPHGLL